MRVKPPISQWVSGFQIYVVCALRIAVLNCSHVNVELAVQSTVCKVMYFPPLWCTWIQWDEQPCGAVSLHLLQRKHKQLSWFRPYQTPNYLWWEESNWSPLEIGLNMSKKAKPEWGLQWRQVRRSQAEIKMTNPYCRVCNFKWDLWVWLS